VAMKKPRAEHASPLEHALREIQAIAAAALPEEPPVPDEGPAGSPATRPSVTPEEPYVQTVETALRTLTDGPRDLVGYFGALGDGEDRFHWWSVRWEGDDGHLDELFANPEYRVAQVLSVLGSEVRLSILRCLLQSPRSVAEIVGEAKLGTTGQAYHHLRELERAGFLEPRDGRYQFVKRMRRVYLNALALALDAAAPDPPEDRV
jgi:DNA-binding transcriptional ArsR family regulator